MIDQANQSGSKLISLSNDVDSSSCEQCDFDKPKADRRAFSRKLEEPVEGMAVTRTDSTQPHCPNSPCHSRQSQKVHS